MSARERTPLERLASMRDDWTKEDWIIFYRKLTEAAEAILANHRAAD